MYIGLFPRLKFIYFLFKTKDEDDVELNINIKYYGWTDI